MTETYTSILAELRRRRDALAAELRGVEMAIAAILPLAGGESAGGRSTQLSVPQERPDASATTTAVVVSDRVAAELVSQVGDYSRLSVRWAALWHLGEFAKGPMRNSEIADAIRAGGYQSSAGSFPNAVSAVLSAMRAKGEIDGNVEIGYFLTDKGRQIWETIKRSERFRTTIEHSSSNGQPLLSVQ
jgi:hypothetical protein